MKKRLIAALLVVLGSGSVAAKITYDEAIKTDDQLNAYNPHTTRTNGFTTSELSLQTSGGSAKHYSTSAINTVRTVTMEPTSTYNCALAGVEGDYRGFMEQGKVYENSGRWILHASAGDTTVTARAVCFPK
ncbi:MULTISPECIES: hypothetical protein [unclassified Vibrio]|uniref:hypothetical protein n=1 Tax=unclassified Vibrio TaxID=2614977 RepID=UPI000B8EE5BF|nr:MULTISPECIES: hypothetical protein [unclassified Vibrio]NAW91744.1 hypothetical protein [Vibrio sp. V24_P1S3T111]OXX19139.1 hypothetical protein B9J86_16165 [Vibrio sp. V06_P1A73T115]OXX20467.1 hypothetical protein B9J88_13790 [Vibrio sp. V05_P4A8T149]OXX36287.1 hypothetical protein B9J81_06335 [Vibrio sp. V04_P4A5T148]OXX55106.1 hypothetical protein B9J91_10145 [Vibrio sp. V18_P1S4T112]